MKEFDLQRQVVSLLHRAAEPNVIFFHAANGEKRDKVTGAKLRMMGVKAGVSDLVIVVQGRVTFLELKIPGGYQSAEQVAFEALCERNGSPYQVAASLEEAADILMAIGALKEVSVA